MLLLVKGIAEGNSRRGKVDVRATDLNYWIKHPFEFSDSILKPEYL